MATTRPQKSTQQRNSPHSEPSSPIARQKRVRTRAVDSQDREQRRNAILDAAEALFARSADRDLSMAQVAIGAGLAKGTLYLYFDSKEVLLLSLHERRVKAFFAELCGALDRSSEFGFSDMAAIVRRHMTEEPLYMALGAIAMAFMDQQIVPGALQTLSDRIAAWLIEAGSKLERKLGGLPDGEGVRMLVHGYAVIVGLWHLLTVRSSAASAAAKHALGTINYPDEAELALARLWTATLSAAAHAQSAVAQPTPANKRRHNHA